MQEIINNDWLKIVLFVLLVIILITSFVSISWEEPSFQKNAIQYILIIISSFIFISILYFYFKDTNNIENKKLTLEFIRMLLPATLAILSLLYALSSGLFNIKNETLKKNKSILQHDINEFKEEKKTMFLELETLKGTLVLAQKELNLKKEEIESFRKDIEEIRKESIDKSEAIEKLRKLNVQYEEELVIFNKNSLDKINKYLQAFQNESNRAISVECLGLYSKGQLQLSFYDTNGNTLTDKHILVKTAHNSGYPDYMPLIGQYNENKSSFELPHNPRIVKGKLIPEVRNIIQITFKALNDTVQDKKNKDWSFELPFENAKYKVTIYRQ